MIAFLLNAFDAWRGARDHAITVPPMDGALSPNQIIEESPVVLAIAAPDNLVRLGDRILFSSGREVRELQIGGPAASSTVLMQMDCAVTALAASAGCALAVGLEDGSLHIAGGTHDRKVRTEVGKQTLRCPVALQFVDEDTLLLGHGSRTNPRSGWKRDLMERNTSGSVWRLNLATGRDDCLGDGLGFPSGLAPLSNGEVVVSEAWRNRIVRLCAGGKPKVELADITGYPGALSPASGGGYWLAVFAPRSQLIEFILRERDFRTCMMEEVDEALWIAPTLEPVQTFLEPLQGGALKHLGILKPWAPTRSFGLVVRLDADFQPVFSMHSRADGRRHGVTSCFEAGDRLLATCRGGNVIVSLPTRDPNGE